MKYLFSLFLMFSITQTVHSQQNNIQTSSNFWNNVRFGGGIGLNFGNGIFSGTIAPSAIYQFDAKVAMGIGLTVSYFKRNNLYKSTVLGGNLIGLFNPINTIQLSTEFEQLHVNRSFDENFITTQNENYWYPALFLGAGYRTGNFTVGIRYDVLYDDSRSIYADPWMPFIRVYF